MNGKGMKTKSIPLPFIPLPISVPEQAAVLVLVY